MNGLMCEHENLNPELQRLTEKAAVEAQSVTPELVGRDGQIPGAR